MALNLGITPQSIAASERAMEAISRQRKLSAEEFISQARRMLGKETSESPKEKDGSFVN